MPSCPFWFAVSIKNVLWRWSERDRMTSKTATTSTSAASGAHLALLMVLILGGNGLVILQFEKARLQTDRLTGVSQQLIAVLRLQESLQSFHQRLNELAQSKDARRLVTEAGPLRAAILEQTQQTRSALAYLPPEFRVDPAFLTALDTIEATLPSQLQDITALAAAGDWEVVRLRLDNELKQMENTTSALVKNIDRDLDEELPRAVANMKDVQRRIFLIVPITAISTVFVAAFFGWAIARRILELRMEERVSERTRIARDLHDTLLQSFQGLMLHLQIVDDLLPSGRSEGKTRTNPRTRGAGDCRGPGRVYDLRSSATTTNELSQAVERLCDELRRQTRAAFQFEGGRCAAELHPIIRDEVYRDYSRGPAKCVQPCPGARILKRNSSMQSVCSGCAFGMTEKGIEPAMLEEGRSGHYGLPGMRERAQTNRRGVQDQERRWSRH